VLFPAESDLVRRDIALKGLGLVLNPERLVDRLRPHLHCNQLRGVGVKYVRYKPGISCLVSYNLEVDGQHIDIYAKAVTPAAVNKLRKAYHKYASLDAAEPHVVILEDYATAIFTFPLDAKINTLPNIAHSESRRHLLRYLLPRRPDLWEVSLESIRYKPEQRFVGRLSVEENPVAKVKVYPPSGYRASSLNAKLLCSRGTLHFPGRIGRSARHQIVMFEWMKGCLLRDLIQESILDLNFMKTVGAALSEIHSQNVSGLYYTTRHDESASLIRAAAELGFIFPHLEKRINKVAQGLSNALTSTPPLNRPIHGDFHSEQILVESDRVIMLDIDNAACSDPSADFGLFFAHLERDSLDGLISQTRLGSAKDAFLQGYRSASGSVPPNIELYTAIGLLRLATDLHKSIARFGEYANNWPQLTELLVDHAWHNLQKNKNTIRSRSVIKSSRNVPVIDPFGLSEEPFLAKALNPAHAEARLREYLLRTPGVENVQLSLRAIRVMRHKPQRRCLIEYDVETKSADAGPEFITLIGKARMRGTDISTYSCVQSLWYSGFDANAPDGIMIPEPLGLIPEYRMWLQRKVPGRAAIELLAGPDGVVLARRLVEAIYKIQQTDIVQHREQHTIVHELDILHRGLSEVSRMRPDWSQRIGRIAHNCDRLAEAVPQCKPVCSHRDFYFDNVIVNGPRLYLLDCDLFCKANPGLDIGNFIAHLTEYALRSKGNPRALEHIERAMEERFNELYDEDAYVSMRTYALLTLVRHIYLSTLTKERCKFTENLLELCEERLAVESHAAALNTLQ
jgi:aminoglycoside phosphotransferase (APT) family kinase protein